MLFFNTGSKTSAISFGTEPISPNFGWDKTIDLPIRVFSSFQFNLSPSFQFELANWTTESSSAVALAPSVPNWCFDTPLTLNWSAGASSDAFVSIGFWILPVNDTCNALPWRFNTIGDSCLDSSTVSVA